MIHEKRVAKDGAAWVEVWRDDAERVWFLSDADADRCRLIRNQNARWKCVQTAAFTHRKKRDNE